MTMEMPLSSCRDFARHVALISLILLGCAEGSDTSTPEPAVDTQSKSQNGVQTEKPTPQLGATVSGSVNGITLKPISVAAGNAGSNQVGILITDIANVSCQSDFDDVLINGYALMFLVPAQSASWPVPRTSVQSGAIAEFWTFRDGSKDETHATSGSVIIDQVKMPGEVKGSFDLKFPNASTIAGTFSTTVCSEIDL